MSCGKMFEEDRRLAIILAIILANLSVDGFIQSPTEVKELA